jgi:hypothetical protein
VGFGGVWEEGREEGGRMLCCYTVYVISWLES